MRDARGRFVKGCSGNSGGSGSQGIGYVRKLAREHTSDAIATLVEIMKNKDARDQARVSAAEALLDRGWGKATQPIESNGEGFHLELYLGGKSE